jgi:hypothetical protein
MEIAVGGYGHFGDNSAHELEDFWKKYQPFYARNMLRLLLFGKELFGGNLGKNLTSDACSLQLIFLLYFVGKAGISFFCICCFDSELSNFFWKFIVLFLLQTVDYYKLLISFYGHYY